MSFQFKPVTENLLCLLDYSRMVEALSEVRTVLLSHSTEKF